MSPTAQSPGKFIRDHREALGWNLQQLADEVGVSTALAGYWERDQKPAVVYYCRAIGEAFNLRDEELLELILLAQEHGESRRRARKRGSGDLQLAAPQAAPHRTA